MSFVCLLEFDMRGDGGSVVVIIRRELPSPVVQDKMAAAVHTDVHAMSYNMSV